MPLVSRDSREVIFGMNIVSGNTLSDRRQTARSLLFKYYHYNGSNSSRPQFYFVTSTNDENDANHENGHIAINGEYLEDLGTAIMYAAKLWKEGKI